MKLVEEKGVSCRSQQLVFYKKQPKAEGRSPILQSVSATRGRPENVSPRVVHICQQEMQAATCISSTNVGQIICQQYINWLVMCRVEVRQIIKSCLYRVRILEPMDLGMTNRLRLLYIESITKENVQNPQLLLSRETESGLRPYQQMGVRTLYV